MLWYVYQGVAKARSIDGVWVLTDSEEVFEVAASWGAHTVMTSEYCPSGTARIASVIDQIDADIIVNVQGDEPLMTGAVVDQLVGAFDGSGFDVVTPVYRITSKEDLENTNINKVVRAADGRALYFSHSTIPFVRDHAPETWLSHVPYWGHVGVYAYRRQVLEGYASLPGGRLEDVEKLEQLRFLEAGISILTVETDYQPRGVDVPAELEEVKKILDPTSFLR